MRKMALGWMVVLGLLVFGPLISFQGRAESWAQISSAIVLQAIPFLVLGVALSATLEVFVPDRALQLIPRRKALAVPVGAASGFLLPACECASVPVTQSLIRRGVPPAAALAFLLASPAINPVVLVSTAVAFGGDPRMMFARLIACLVAAIIIGWVWLRWAPKDVMAGAKATHEHSHGSGAQRWEHFRDACLHDLLNAGGYLVLGAMIAAALKVLVPLHWLLFVSERPVVACAVMVLLAVVLSLCSEADAFVAAAMSMMPATAQLLFLVVGPMVDVKLIAMQQGAWGWGFVARFVPLTLVVSVLVGAVVGVVFFHS